MMRKFTTAVLSVFILGGLLTGCTPKPTDIFDAIKANDLGKVEQILKLYPEVVKMRKSISSDWPLLYACESKNPDPKMLTALLKASLKEHATLATLNSFVDLLNKRHFQLCDLFIKNGFDINETTPDGAIGIENSVIQRRNVTAFKYLLSHNADVNFNKGVNDPPLVNAVESGDVQIVKLLVKAGADLNVLDYKNQTALMDATFNKTGSAMIKLLLDAGANINYRDDSGICAFLYAETKEQIKLFLMHGQNINVKDNEGHGIIYALIGNVLFYQGRDNMIYKAVKFALQNGAQVNYKVDHGWPLLKAAINFGVPSRFIKLLRAYGAHM